MNPITRLKCAVRDIMRDVLNNRKRRVSTDTPIVEGH